MCDIVEKYFGVDPNEYEEAGRKMRTSLDEILLRFSRSDALLELGDTGWTGTPIGGKKGAGSIQLFDGTVVISSSEETWLAVPAGETGGYDLHSTRIDPETEELQVSELRRSTVDTDTLAELGRVGAVVDACCADLFSEEVGF